MGADTSSATAVGMAMQESEESSHPYPHLDCRLSACMRARSQWQPVLQLERLSRGEMLFGVAPAPTERLQGTTGLADPLHRELVGSRVNAAARFTRAVSSTCNHDLPFLMCRMHVKLTPNARIRSALAARSLSC